LRLSLEARYWRRRPSRFSGRLKRTWCYPLTVLMPE
jgi:hypothetical protein